MMVRSGIAAKSIRNAAIAVAVGLSVAACAGQPLVSDRQVARDRVESYLSANPATAPETAVSMRSFDLRAGMSKQEVLAVWGPVSERRKWRGGTVEQLLFGCGWPVRCEIPDRDAFLMGPIRPQAFFRDGRLFQWSSP